MHLAQLLTATCAERDAILLLPPFDGDPLRDAPRERHHRREDQQSRREEREEQATFQNRVRVKGRDSASTGNRLGCKHFRVSIDLFKQPSRKDVTVQKEHAS